MSDDTAPAEPLPPPDCQVQDAPMPGTAATPRNTMPPIRNTHQHRRGGAPLAQLDAMLADVHAFIDSASASSQKTSTKQSTVHTTGSLPLQNNQYEQFTIAVFQNMPKWIAYQQFVRPGTMEATCHTGASVLLRRPEVKDRLAFLQAQNSLRAKAGKMVEGDLRSVLECVATAGRDADRIAAATKLKDWIDRDKEKSDAAQVSDPAEVAARLAGWVRGATEMPLDRQVEYARQIIQDVGLPPAAWLKAITPAGGDRAAAPLPENSPCPLESVTPPTEIGDNNNQPVSPNL